MQSSWSEERIALLEQMVPQGHSYTICAARISALPGPRISRNAAIGKATRLGIAQKRSGRPVVPRKKTARKPHPKNLSFEQRALAQARIEAFRAEPDLDIPPEQRKPILVRDAKGRLCANDALDAQSCRWPFGTGTKDDPYAFCGKEKVRGLSYCPFHQARSSDGPMLRRRTSFRPVATVSAEKENANA